MIDYAGLFPPASLDMPTAMGNYAEYLAGPDVCVLGRLVVPASRLHELSAQPLPGEPLPAHAWRISVIADDGLAEVKESALEFNCMHWDKSQLGHAIIDSVEIVVSSSTEVLAAAEIFQNGFTLFLEVPLIEDRDVVIASMARTRAAAKIRTGGVVPAAIPSSADVCRFLAVCIKNGVSFKATAGLHHAIRGDHPLTYRADSPRGMMHGYVNVLTATALLCARASPEAARAALDETDPAAISLAPGEARWRDHSLDDQHLHRARQMMISFGSCSFREPVDEARALGIL